MYTKLIGMVEYIGDSPEKGRKFSSKILCFQRIIRIIRWGFVTKCQFHLVMVVGCLSWPNDKRKLMNRLELTPFVSLLLLST